MRKPTRHLRFLAVAITALLGLASTAHAAPIGYSGTFAEDDDHFEVFFAVASAGQVSIQTWSYAGGLTPLGTVVPAGGFAPVLSLFDPSDALLALDTGGTAPGGCGPRGIDPVTGFCLDAFLSLMLGPGTYHLVLTQYDNTPFGPTYADGFLHDGEGNFTGPTFTGLPGSFIDPGLNQRTSAFALSLTVPTDNPVPVPEPGTLVMLASGSILSALRRRRARHSRSHSSEPTP